MNERNQRKNVGKRFMHGMVGLLALFISSATHAATQTESLSAATENLKAQVNALKVSQPQAFQRLNATVVQLSSMINKLNLVTSSVFVIPTTTQFRGATFDIPISLISGSIQPAGFQMDIILPEGVKVNSVKAGQATKNAGKTLASNTVNGNTRILVFGLNQTLLSPGEVALVNVTLADTAATMDLPISVIGQVASDKAGTGIPISIMSGTIISR